MKIKIEKGNWKTTKAISNAQRDAKGERKRCSGMPLLFANAQMRCGMGIKKRKCPHFYREKT